MKIIIKEGKKKKQVNEIFGLGKYEKKPEKQAPAGQQPAKKGFLQKVSDVFKGVQDIGLTGGGTTLLGGEETFDIETRNKKRGEAKAKVEGWLSKIGDASNPNVAALNNLYKGLSSEKFPNTDRAVFDADVKKIQDTYKTLVDNYNKSKKTPDDAKATNNLIAVLRGIVIYFQDYAISDKYLYLKEAEEAMGAKAGDVSKSYQAAYGAQLPLGLALAGVSAMTLGLKADKIGELLAKYKDMKDVPTEVVQKDLQTSMIDDASKALQIGKGQGITQALGKATGVDLSPNAPLKNLLDPKVSEYLDSVKKAVIEKNGPAGGKAWEQVLQMAQDPKSAGKSLADIFKGQLAGTGKSAADMLDVNPGTFQNVVKKAVTKAVQKTVTQMAKQPADTLKNKFIGFMSSGAMAGIGAGLLGGAAASAAMRAKGSGKFGEKRGSRMNDLKLVVDKMADVQPGEQATPAGVPGGAPKPAGGAGAAAAAGGEGPGSAIVPAGKGDMAAAKGAEAGGEKGPGSAIVPVTKGGALAKTGAAAPAGAEKGAPELGAGQAQKALTGEPQKALPAGQSAIVPAQQAAKEIQQDFNQEAVGPDDLVAAITRGGKPLETKKVDDNSARQIMQMMGLSPEQMAKFFAGQTGAAQTTPAKKAAGKKDKFGRAPAEPVDAELVNENKKLKKTYLLSEVKKHIDICKELDRMKVLAGIK